jgi:hypothetical protein
MVTINVVPFDRSNVSPFWVEVDYNDQGHFIRHRVPLVRRFRTQKLKLPPAQLTQKQAQYPFYHQQEIFS